MHVGPFLAVAVVVVVTPGVDVALVTRNAVRAPARQATLDRITGALLIGLGLRLALERR